MTNAVAPADAGEPVPGVIVGAASLDEVIEQCRAHDVAVIGLPAGPGEALGIHLGARVRDDYRRRLQAAGLRLITVTAPPELLADRPDEGVAADVADYLDLAADVGAESLTLTLTPAQAVARVAGGPDGERAVARLRMLAEHAASLDVAAVLKNAPAVPGIAQVIDLIDVLHDQLGDGHEARTTGTAPGAAADGGTPATDDGGGSDRDSDSDRTGTGQEPSALAGSTRSPTTRDPATDVPGQPVVIGAAWDVAMSAAAGEDVATGWSRAQRLLLQSHGHVVAPDAATAAALHRAVPASTPVPVLVAGEPVVASASVASGGGAEPGGAAPGGAEPGGAEPDGPVPGGAEPGGAGRTPPRV